MNLGDVEIAGVDPFALLLFHEDFAHSGFDDPTTTQPWKAKLEPKVWTHALTASLPARIDCAGVELDVEGTFNARLDENAKRSFLAGVKRVLRPGGTVAVHGMAGRPRDGFVVLFMSGAIVWVHSNEVPS